MEYIIIDAKHKEDIAEKLSIKAAISNPFMLPTKLIHAIKIAVAA